MPQAFSSHQKAGQNGDGVRREGEMRPLPLSLFPFPAIRFEGLYETDSKKVFSVNRLFIKAKRNSYLTKTNHSFKNISQGKGIGRSDSLSFLSPETPILSTLTVSKCAKP